MNRLIISDQGFPMNVEWLTFLENLSVEQLTGLSKILGDKAIVYGMEENGLNLTDGFLTYNEELLPFVESPVAANINVIEETTSAGYDINGTNDFSTILPTWKTRKAKFAEVGDTDVVATFPFADLRRIGNMLNLARMAAVGQINMVIDEFSALSIFSSGDYTSAELVGDWNSLNYKFKVEFPEVDGDYFPVITRIDTEDEVQNTSNSNIYVVEKTSTYMIVKAVTLYSDINVLPVWGEFMRTYEIALLKYN